MAAEQRWHPISPYQQTESKAFYGKIYQELLNDFLNLLLFSKDTEYTYGATVAHYSSNLGYGDITNS